MARTIKMCDMPIAIAAKTFEMLNPGKVHVNVQETECFIVTDVHPDDLTYPEGWYFAKGAFRNKHTSTTGIYQEAPMLGNI